MLLLLRQNCWNVKLRDRRVSCMILTSQAVRDLCWLWFAARCSIVHIFNEGHWLLDAQKTYSSALTSGCGQDILLWQVKRGDTSQPVPCYVIKWRDQLLAGRWHKLMAEAEIFSLLLNPEPTSLLSKEYSWILLSDKITPTHLNVLPRSRTPWGTASTSVLLVISWWLDIGPICTFVTIVRTADRGQSEVRVDILAPYLEATRDEQP